MSINYRQSVAQLVTPTSPHCSPPFIMTVPLLVVVVAQPPRGHAGCVSLNTSLFMCLFSWLSLSLCVIYWIYCSLFFNFLNGQDFGPSGFVFAFELGLSYSVAGPHQSSPIIVPQSDTIAQMCTIVGLVFALGVSNLTKLEQTSLEYFLNIYFPVPCRILPQIMSNLLHHFTLLATQLLCLPQTSVCYTLAKGGSYWSKLRKGLG